MNFYVDPKAPFAAGFDITLAPWAPRLRCRTPFTRTCAATLDFDRRACVDGTTHPDSLTLATLLHPHLIIRTGRSNVDAETAGDPARRYAAMSCGVHNLAPNTTAVEDADAEGLADYIKGLPAKRKKRCAESGTRGSGGGLS